jgi:hypothetical protein
LSVLDRNLIEQIASGLGTNPGLVEKDWHVVRALGVLAGLEHKAARPVFSGGTSLAKGWGLIKRFSEDIDFKVGMQPAATSKAEGRRLRSAYREEVLSALTSKGFELVGNPLIGNESQFFAADLAYPSRFTAARGLRPHIRVEMSFHEPALKPIDRPISSFIALAAKQPPEVASFPCIDPIETAADKLSTLAWRVCARERGSADDDPTIIRHLHDLAALESHVAGASGFAALARQTAEDDTGRGGGGVPANASARFTVMLERLRDDKLWTSEYETFVLQVSFAKPGGTISFAEAFAATRRLVDKVYRNTLPL